MFNKLKFLSKMKKIKLFALAAFAMLSTNAFAAAGWGDVKSTDTFTYQPWLTDDTDPTTENGTARITGFVNGLTAAQMETVTIPATIVVNSTKSYYVIEVDGADGLSTPFAGNTNIKKVVFEENEKLTTIGAKSFEECSSLTEIDLSKVKNLENLGANALAGSSIVTLDLSKTKVRKLNEFNDATLATYYTGKGEFAKAAAVEKNITLTSVILPDTWTDIYANAFKNCTALKTVNFQTANPAWVEFAGIGTGGQKINAGAFVGTVIEEIDLSGTYVNIIPVATFKAADVDNTALKTVKLNKYITALNANFARCLNLTSIDIETATLLVKLVENEFQYDAKLTSIDLKNVTTLQAADPTKDGFQFAGTGLTSVTIPAKIATIPVGCFQDCANLTTVEFKHPDDGTFNGIATMAFAGDTKLTTITIPACLAKGTAGAVASRAFFMCTGLKTVTYKPAEDITAAVLHTDAFESCNDNNDANKIVITKNDHLLKATCPEPKCTKYAESGAEEDPFILNLIWEKAEYASAAGKYYVKVKTPAGKYIQVKAAANTKAYEAYLDATAGTMYMIPYMVKGGYFKIGNGAATQQALIITDNADIAYEAADESTSPLSEIAAYNNAMVILDAAKSYTEIMATAAAGQVIYGWANSATKGTGWLKVTSGTLKAKSLYILAKPAAAGARLNVVWLDEDGNVDEELTAIQNVKAAKAENGAIYNLAGQKVNASYKGVVIKDGKKYIQK